MSAFEGGFVKAVVVESEDDGAKVFKSVTIVASGRLRGV
jgi:hypothetical protein